MNKIMNEINLSRNNYQAISMKIQWSQLICQSSNKFYIFILHLHISFVLKKKICCCVSWNNKICNKYDCGFLCKFIILRINKINNRASMENCIMYCAL